MSIKDQENELFRRLKEMHNNIVQDGVSNEKEYNSAKYKIAYVLKEVNGGEEWSLSDFVNEGGRSETWNNIARWTEGILNLDKDYSWAELDVDSESNEERRKKYLPKICAINIKKTAGGHTSDMDEINAAATKYKDILIAQMNLYEPNIIIACGTEKACKELNYFFERKIGNSDWKMTHRGVWYINMEGRIFISFSHPEARVKSSYLYYALIDAVREILSD